MSHVSSSPKNPILFCIYYKFINFQHLQKHHPGSGIKQKTTFFRRWRLLRCRVCRAFSQGGTAEFGHQTTTQGSLILVATVVLRMADWWLMAPAKLTSWGKAIWPSRLGKIFKTSQAFGILSINSCYGGILTCFSWQIIFEECFCWYVWILCYIHIANVQCGRMYHIHEVVKTKSDKWIYVNND